VADARPVIWSDPALADLDAAFTYFLERSPSYARKFLDAVESAADSLGQFSERGRVVPELAVPTIRELFVEKHRLVYEIQVERVDVLRLVQGKQDCKSTWKSQP
jgi:plasmid stabilization system protein ParE